LPDEEEQKRWLGEPVRTLLIPTNIFLTNKRSFPILNKVYKYFIQSMIRSNVRDINVIIKGASLHQNLKYYAQYIDHINATIVETDSLANFARGYEDYLQIPLQPLMDNLDSGTYEIFEKDPVKYREYQKAITQALTNIKSEEKIIILVVGAGRGPLVRACLTSASIVQKSVHIYAIEKNPNAVITLKCQQWEQAKESNSVVEIISSDIRQWDAPQKADVVVSELLGSFGDNELSPECLDGVWQCVKPNAISIPRCYRSYISPVMSHKLYTETAALRDRDKPYYFPFECCYVVFMNNCYMIGEPQRLFTFDHSDLAKRPLSNNNRRYANKTFQPLVDCVCHGFAGYFEAELHDNIKISTVPATYSRDMFSWFPMWIPLREPVSLKRGQSLQLHFWRQTNTKAVWYEWCLSSPIVTNIQNPNGRSHSIGLA